MSTQNGIVITLGGHVTESRVVVNGVDITRFVRSIKVESGIQHPVTVATVELISPRNMQFVATLPLDDEQAGAILAMVGAAQE